jgi:4-amino-4-deoxy-L-arabinose transferase-like glycosyltransferase
MRFPKPLCALMFFFIAASAAWLLLNRAPSQWDDSWYLTNSLTLFDSLGGGLPAYAKAYLSMLRIKPPLITVLPTPIYLLLGRNPRLAYLVDLAAMPVMLGALYSIARRLGTRTTALVAVFIAGTMPLLYGLSHWFLVDYLLTALVCLTVYLVFIALERQETRIFFWMGTVCGLGLLVKISFPLYVFLPILYLLIRSSKSGASLIALLAPALALTLPWYALNYRDAIARAFFSGYSPLVHAAGYGTGPVFSVRAISTYLFNLINSGASAYYSLLALALLPFWIRPTFWKDPTRHRPERLVLILWAFPFAIFLFAPNKDLRLVAPILPVLALILAFALTSAARGNRIGLTGVLVVPLTTFLHTSFGLLGKLQLSVGPVIFTARELHFAGVYQRTPWPHREILEHIVHAAKIVNGVKPLVLVATDTADFNVNNFELAAVQYHLPLNIAASAYETDQASLLASLRSASFVIYKDGGTPEPGGFNHLQNALRQEVETGEVFREIPFGLPLPDGGTARIFANVSPFGMLSESAFSRAGSLPRLTDIECNFGGQILLTGFALEHTPKALAVRLRWRCLKPPAHNYLAFVHILDQHFQLVGGLDHRLMDAWPPAVTWRPGDEAVETMLFPLALGQNKGSYRLRLGLYDSPAGERLPIQILSSSDGFSTTDKNTALLTPAQ